MNNKYGKIKCIFINNDPYWIHEHILQQMSIFAVLFDESFDQQNINIELENYNQNVICRIFDILYDLSKKEMFAETSTNIQMIQLMMYFGLDNKIINKYVKKISKKTDILENMIKLPYHECFNIILDYYDTSVSSNDYNNYLKIVNESDCPESYKTKFVEEVSGCVMYDNSDTAKFAWTENIGHNLIKNVAMSINDQEIETFTKIFNTFWNQFTEKK